MELALVVFSAVSAISTTVLTFLVLQTQKNIDTNAKKRTESDLNSYKQIESLLQRNQAIEQKLVELTDAQGKSINKVCEQLTENRSTQSINLKTIIDTLEMLKKNIDALYKLLQESGGSQVAKLKTVIEKLEELKNSLEESITF